MNQFVIIGSLSFSRVGEKVYVRGRGYVECTNGISSTINSEKDIYIFNKVTSFKAVNSTLILNGAEDETEMIVCREIIEDKPINYNYSLIFGFLTLYVVIVGVRRLFIK